MIETKYIAAQIRAVAEALATNDTRRAGSHMIEVAVLVESLSSTDSSEPGAPVYAGGDPLSEHDMHHVLSELFSNMEPGFDEEAIRDELDGNYTGDQIDQIVHRWLTGCLVDRNRELDRIREWLNLMDADRMGEDEFEKEQKLAVMDRLARWATYVAQVEGDYTTLRLREQRRKSLASQGVEQLVAQIENQKETIRMLRGRADAPVPTFDQLVNAICVEPEKFEEAVAVAALRDAGVVRSALSHAIVSLAGAIGEHVGAVSGGLLQDAIGIEHIIEDAKRDPSSPAMQNPIVSPDRQIGECTCGDECVSPQSALCRKRRATIYPDSTCTCGATDNMDLDPDCPAHGRGAMTDEEIAEASLEQTEEERKFTRGTDWEQA